ncbi:MAG: 5-formyltetrahydrofolate cyclo-ligase [Clostridia bacterium]|nr:5-formyltetrahydrofolate cyclo-ligase [Clostridia bacterium]
MTKSEARKSAIEFRKSLSNVELREKSAKIVDKLLSLNEVKNSRELCVYLALPYEVDLTEFIECLYSSGKSICAPKTVGSDMVAIRFSGFDKCKSGNFNVLEPIGDVVDKSAIDVVVVPLVAYNESKSRVGYGKGYYDRFLEDDMIKIGVAFEGQKRDFEPDSFDKTLDMIVTENRIIR